MINLVGVSQGFVGVTYHERFAREDASKGDAHIRPFFGHIAFSEMHIFFSLLMPMEKIILSKHKSTKRFQLNEVDCRTWLCTLGNLCSICNNTHQLVEIQKEISFSSRLLHYLESIDNIEYIYICILGIEPYFNLLREVFVSKNAHYWLWKIWHLLVIICTVIPAIFDFSTKATIEK